MRTEAPAISLDSLDAFTLSYAAYLRAFLPSRSGQAAPVVARAGQEGLAGQDMEGAIAMAEMDVLAAWHRELQQDFTLIHGSCIVSQEGQVVLIPGVTGSGKTCLSLALVQRGYRFLTDDCTAIDPATGRIWPVPAATHLKGERPAALDLDRVMWRLLSYPSAYQVPNARCAFVRSEHIPIPGESFLPGMLLFPAVRGAVEPEGLGARASASQDGAMWAPLPPGQAAYQLTFHNLADGNTTIARDFRVISNLARRAPAYRLLAADLETACQVVGSLAAGIPARAGQ